MMKPGGRGLNDGLGPIAQDIHDASFWAIAGVVMTTRWDREHRFTRVGLWCDKVEGQELSFGHEGQMRLFEKLIPHSRAMVVWYSHDGDPLMLWTPRFKHPKPVTPDQLKALFAKYATEQPEL